MAREKSKGPPSRRRKSGPKATPGACARCGKPARDLKVGPWTFCRPQCRGAFLTARSRKAAKAGKKLKCPLCGRPNAPRASTCAHCGERILWAARSPIRTGLVWLFRGWLAASLVGVAYVAYQFRDFIPLLGGGSEGANAVSMLGQPGVASSEAMLGQSLVQEGVTAKDLRAIVEKKGKAVQKLPGPGTWLVPGAGMPPLIFAEDPALGTLFPQSFDKLPPAERGKVMLGLITSRKIVMKLKPTQIRVVSPGEAFSRIEVLEGNPGSGGWALNGQIAGN